MAILGIAHVQVSILPGGEQLARDFYGDVLQLEEIEKPATLQDRGGAWFACGAQEIHCGVEPEVAASRRHPALLTDDLDAMEQRLATHGFPVSHERELPGYRRFYSRDPFGNRLEFLQPIGVPA